MKVIKNKKALVLTLIICMLSSTGLNLSAAQDVKIEDWPLMKEAIAYESAKDYDLALPYWEKLVALYEQYNTKAAYENGGIYANKVGDYYAGIYNKSVFEPTKATLYYEKSYDLYKKLSALDGTTKYNWAYVSAQRKIDGIKSELDLYIKKDLAISAPFYRELSKHEPESGLYLGTYGENNASLYTGFSVDPEAIKSTYGKYSASLLYYNNYGSSPFASAAAQKMKAIGGSLQIHMQPHNLDEVVDGDYIRTFAKAAKESGIPIFLRFGGEMNGDWVPWGLQPKKYIEKFRLIHDIMEQEAPNVAMVWAPNFFPWDNMASYYPGDKYVDWVGVSCYTTLSYTSETKELKLKANPIDLLKPIVDLYSDRKPIMVVEGAASHYSTTEPKIDYSDWGVNNLKRFYQYIPMVYPQIKAFYYYDSVGAAGARETYMLTDNDEMKAAYKSIIQGDYYLSDMGQADFKYELLSLNLEKKSQVISAYVKSYEPEIARVEYYIDDRLVGTVHDLPFEMTYDFSKLTKSSVKLTAKAFLKSGKLAIGKEYQLNLIPQTIRVLYDDEYLRFDQPPIVVEGRTLVPMRTIFEVFGMNVTYDDASKTVTAKNKDHTITLTIGNNTAYVDGEAISLDAAPCIVSGWTLVPLRFISQSMGLDVTYNEDSRMITLGE